MSIRVLVTGGSGFVAGHCILRLLKEGHEVRTTVRSLRREPEVREILKSAGAEDQSKLSFVVADLEKEDGWQAATSGCDYVLHVASPFPLTQPKDDEEIIRPAREGTLRVLRASRDAGVKRVVVTSSFAAIGYGHKPGHAPFTEKDWSNVEGPNMTAYFKSKTLAEQSAWDFIKNEGKGLELTVINPVGIFGPALGPDLSVSVGLIKMLLDGKMAASPRLMFGVVDVRDLADLHVIAMTHPKAKGERFLASAEDTVTLFQVAKALRKGMGQTANKTPRFELPNWLVKIGSKFNPQMKSLAPELIEKHISNEKVIRVLNWKPRSSEEAVIASGESLVQLGLLNG